jgi:hypothetical protein
MNAASTPYDPALTRRWRGGYDRCLLPLRAAADGEARADHGERGLTGKPVLVVLMCPL